ncbi:MAG: ankyrin repeat domain-containing protein [Woeseiaceae bacterium]|jgi:uncharacterized protein
MDRRTLNTVRPWVGVLALLSAGMQVAAAAGHDVITAAKDADLSQLKAALDREGTDVNAAQGDGATALAWAAYHDDEEAVDLLLRAGADPGAANDYGVAPLHLACTNRNDAIIAKLIKADADVDGAKWNGETPLMTCVRTGAAAGVNALLAAGANPNVKETREDQTPLMWAAAKGHADIVKALVARGARTDAQSKLIPAQEPFVIEVPSSFGRNFPKPVRFREASGGFTPLLFAAQSGNVEIAKALLDAGAEIDFATLEEGSALVIAVAAGHEDFARYLLERGADPNIADGWGVTALHYTAHEGLLILNGYARTNTDHLGWQRSNTPALIKPLLDAGANVEARVTASFSFLDNEFLRGNEDPPQIDPTGATPLLLAAASGDVESMRILFEQGKADIEVTTDSGATLFMLAAGAGSEMDVRDELAAIEAAKYAMELGDTAVNARLTNDDAVNGPGAGKIDGRTALHFAANLGWEHMVRFLAEVGAELDPADRYGQTPLMIAMGDPESRYYRNIPIGRYDDRYRRPPNAGFDNVVAALLEVGASPFTGTVVDKGSVN